MSALTLMTYNIRTGIGNDLTLNLNRTANIIEENRPHVVGLQEVDHHTNRTNNVDQAYVLGDLLIMNVVYGPAYAFDGGHFGPATLSSLPIVNEQCTTLPFEPQVHESRMLIMTEVLWHDRPVTVFNTHLEHADPAMRQRQAQVVSDMARIKSLEGPTVVMGDLNAVPDEPGVAPLLRESFQDVYELAYAKNAARAEKTLGRGFTYSSASPTKRIDYIWVSEHFQLADVLDPVVIVDNDASDHRAVVAKITWR